VPPIGEADFLLIGEIKKILELGRPGRETNRIPRKYRRSRALRNQDLLGEIWMISRRFFRGDKSSSIRKAHVWIVRAEEVLSLKTPIKAQKT